MKNVALILSGCGVYDGSEIHEAILSMLALTKHNIEYQCFAPERAQHHVVNHITGEEMEEQRNILVESARIARGNIKALSELNVADFDGILFPGGFGAAKNLCNYAFLGKNYDVDPEVADIIRRFHASQKPIGALCIAPVIIGKIINAEITIGNDPETAAHIEAQGATHIERAFDEVAIDKANKVVTNPCYMVAKNIYEVSVGAEATVLAMKEL